MLTKTQKALLALNVLLVLGYGIFYWQQQNFEFLAYVGTIALVTAGLFGTLQWTRFPTLVIVGITIWAIMHMMGGSIQTADGVLYAWRIYPFFDGGGEFYILKFDQVVHAFLYGVIGVMFYHIIRNIVGVQTHHILTVFIAAFAAAGFSILNEIVEFLAAVNLPETGVGGYHNTVLDLIFNLSGAFLGIILYTLFRRRL